MKSVLLTSATIFGALALPNGLGLTPQMGWNDWNFAGCGISEALVREQGALLISTGLAAAGYVFLNLDDCWMATRDNVTHVLTPDPSVFPSSAGGAGMRPLADWAHSQGLRFGLYTARCRETCQRRPASRDYIWLDAQTFANWTIDYLKEDSCVDCDAGDDAIVQYAEMAEALNATGRPIFFSLCDGDGALIAPVGAQLGNSWRIGDDINPNWEGAILRLLDTSVSFAQYSGVGGWNDADMLEVGNGMGFTADLSHFALWCMLASPLLIGSDIKRMSNETLAILSAPELIAINQDAFGIQAVRAAGGPGLTFDILWRPLSTGAYAVTLLNRNASSPISLTIKWSSLLGLNATTPAYVRDAWTRTTLGTFVGNFTSRPLNYSDSQTVVIMPTVIPAYPCAYVPEHSIAAIRCFNGTRINAITFANYGQPTGSCATGFAVNASCSVNTSMAIVSAACVGLPTCSVPAENDYFGTDPCPTLGKQLAIEATCA